MQFVENEKDKSTNTVGQWRTFMEIIGGDESLQH